MTRQNEFWLYKSYQLYVQPQKAIKSRVFLEFFALFPLDFGALSFAMKVAELYICLRLADIPL